jgi:hypothetical protein
MMEHQVEQDNPRNPKVFRKSARHCKKNGGFDWDNTPEEYDFWHSIIVDENFDEFYKLYPKKDTKPKTFTCPVSMEVTEEQYEKDLKPILEKYGYLIKYMWSFKDFPILGTNYRNTSHQVSNVTVEDKQYNKRYFIDHYNPKLFLALAALNETDDYMCWFKDTNDGDVEQLPIHNPCSGNAVWHKMTKEELIEEFSLKDNIYYLESSDAHIHSLDISKMKIKEIKVGDNQEIIFKDGKYVVVDKKKIVKTWKDIEKISGAYISNTSNIYETNNRQSIYENRNIFIDKKHAESALAMAMISQLLPYYGGEITKEEWGNDKISKYVILRIRNIIKIEPMSCGYHVLGFHTRMQCEEFLKNNEELVNSYLMMD